METFRPIALISALFRDVSPSPARVPAPFARVEIDEARIARFGARPQPPRQTFPHRRRFERQSDEIRGEARQNEKDRGKRLKRAVKHRAVGEGGAFAARPGGHSRAKKVEEAPHVGKSQQRRADGKRDRREKPDGPHDQRESENFQHDPGGKRRADKL